MKLIKMALVAAKLNAEVIPVVTVQREVYIISLFPYLHSPVPNNLDFCDT